VPAHRLIPARTTPPHVCLLMETRKSAHAIVAPPTTTFSLHVVKGMSPATHVLTHATKVPMWPSPGNE
jgi:hypothetical protein